MPTNRPSRTQPPPVEQLVEPIPYFTLRECGEILGINQAAVWQAEQRAFRKIAADVVIQRLWRELCEER